MQGLFACSNLGPFLRAVAPAFNLYFPMRLQPLFPLGRTVQTRGVADLGLSDEVLRSLLARHVFGDWRGMTAEDQRSNEEAVMQGGLRVFSSYMVRVGDAEVKVWVITEADRSSTTILLPREY
jgi:hypothetical protein